jgi:hypothetical protein
MRFAILLALISTSSLAATLGQQPPTTNTGTIRGRVVNESGQPLSDVAVAIRGYGLTGNGRQTLTDRDGAFQFNGLPAVVYLFSARSPSYILAPRDPDNTQATSYRVGDNVTLVMIKGGAVTGKVTTASGEPIVGVRVRTQMVRDSFGQRSRYGAATQEQTTDDRGVYRIYGLATGTYLVMAGGGNLGLATYRNDAPTYTPSSTRDTAAEVSVQAGQTTSDVDIRYRGNQGHVISGVATGPLESEATGFSIMLTSTLDGGSQLNEGTYQAAGQSFSFYGLPDGDYDVTAQSYFQNGDRWLSAPKRVNVRGADVTGVELTTKPLASITGRVVLEDSNAPECKEKPRALVTETLISAWHNQKEAGNDQPQFVWGLGGPAHASQQGEISLRNLAAGQYQIISRLFANYWYLRSITVPATQPGKQSDAVANWVTLRSGVRLSGLTVTLAEGAASLEGQVKLNEGEMLPPRLYVYLVPADNENEKDVLRFFAAPVTADRKIAVKHIPPGRYFIVTQPALEGAMPVLTTLRLPDEKETRARLRRDAEQSKIEIEFKPCQNITDYELHGVRRPGAALVSPL